MIKKKWIIKNSKSDSLIESLLENRNILKEEKNLFLSSNIENLHDPFLMKDLGLAVNRILNAISNKEKICIYGDYDVDGISSVSILKLAFLKLKYHVEFYIPKRVEEGYGLNKDALLEIKNKGIDLVITVDCGITSIEEADFANQINLDIIITDHHECKDDFPKATAIINPKQKGCHYPYPNLCGAGIALKLSEGILYENGIKDIDELIEIACIATIADIVELKGENRIIVKYGLEKLKNPMNLGIKALISTSGLNFDNISSTEIAFLLAPRINSSGRMGDAALGVNLFLSKNYSLALEKAMQLEVLNRKRQEIEQNIYEEAITIIESKEKKSDVLVAYSENWHSGVIGIVASKITEKYNKPTFIIAIEENNIGKGSGRSIEGFNLFESLAELSDLLYKYGGHEQAAGITIKQENIDFFEKKINQIGKSLISNDMSEPKIFIDSILEKETLSLNLLNEISVLEPFGMGNKKPVFSVSNIKLNNVKLIGKDEKHFKGYLSDSIEVICFNKPEIYNNIDFNKSVDFVFEMGINNYLGKKNLQLLVKDVKQSFPFYKIFEMYTKNLKNIKELEQLNYKPFLKNEPYNNIFTEINDLDIWLSEKKKIGFFVYDYDLYFNLIRTLFYRNIDFSLESNPVNHKIDIILMPNIDKIALSIYNNIILDISINKISLQLLDFENLNLYYLNQFNNIEIYLNNVPSRDIIAQMYKLIKKHTNIRTDLDLLAKFLNINNISLLNGLETLKEIDLIDYNLLKNQVNISFQSSDSNQKFDLSQTKTMRLLNTIFN